MIYLHHTPLSKILTSSHDTPMDKRKKIADYRHELLSQFCHARHLPTPIYDTLKNGKPFISNIANLSFNQSHCQTGYGLIYSLDIKDIGIDIENINRAVNFNLLAKRYFHPEECLFWQNNHHDKVLWFKLWTIKEAVLKAHGLGIRMALKELQAIFMDTNSGYVMHEDMGKFYFHHRLINDCMMTVAYPFIYGRVDIIEQTKVIIKA